MFVIATLHIKIQFFKLHGLVKLLSRKTEILADKIKSLNFSPFVVSESQQNLGGQLAFMSWTN